MEKINNILNFQQPKESERKQLPAETLSVLWVAMAEMFGTKWTNHYGDTPLTSWAVALADLTDRHIARGIRAVMDSGSEWPPSLPAFKAMCKAGENLIPKFVAPLEKKPTEEERQEFVENIKKLREMLKGDDSA
jgi:hypothetical protein